MRGVAESLMLLSVPGTVVRSHPKAFRRLCACGVCSPLPGQPGLEACQLVAPERLMPGLLSAGWLSGVDEVEARVWG